MEIAGSRLASLIAAGLLAAGSAGAASFPAQIAADSVVEGKVLEVAADGSVVVKVKGVGQQRYQLPAGAGFPSVQLDSGDKVTVSYLAPDAERVDKRWVRIEIKNGATLEPIFPSTQAPQLARVAPPKVPAPTVVDPVKPKEEPKPAAEPINTGGTMPCFITTAVCTALGAADDGPELTLAREFRASFMQQTASRRSDVAAYDVVAPPIVWGVSALPNAEAVWRCVWEDYLAGIKELIELGEGEAAHQRYRQMVLDLNEALRLTLPS